MLDETENAGTMSAIEVYPVVIDEILYPPEVPF